MADDDDPDAALRLSCGRSSMKIGPAVGLCFDQSRRSFVSIDRKLMLRATIAQIRKRFSLQRPDDGRDRLSLPEP